MFKTFNNLTSPLANKITANGDEYLYFGGTAYLGIPQNDDFLKLHLEGLKLFGVNNGTSRGNNIQLGIYSEAEAFAAAKYGAEEALITSSGYLAAQLAIKQVLNLGEVRYAPETHPALWQDKAPNVYSSFTKWSANTKKEINTSTIKKWVVICNSMNNLYPERYDFSFLKKLNKQVVLVVDDSHGIGINNNGLSVLSAIPKCENVEIIVVASMAKALGVDAGLILASQKMIEMMKQSNEFLGASPPAAAGLFAFMNATKIYENELNSLKINMGLLSKKLYGNEEWEFISDFPVYLSKNAELSSQLEKKNILISSFPYPDKNGPLINRIVLSSWHTTLDIEELIKKLSNI